jgi:hypothetical protein
MRVELNFRNFIECGCYELACEIVFGNASYMKLKTALCQDVIAAYYILRPLASHNKIHK